MPAPPLTCLEALVGLAPEALPCFPFPADADDKSWITNSSRSQSAAGGVWVTRLAGLNFQTVQRDPGQDIYERLAKARSEAAKYARQYIVQAPKYASGQARYAAKGLLGKAGNGSPYLGAPVLALPTYKREAGAYKVTALALQTTVSTAGVVILLDGAPVAMITTNGPLQPVTPFYIPFDGQVHTLTPVLPGGVRPLVGQLYCRGCSGGNAFSDSVASSLIGVTPATSSVGFLLQVEETCATEAADVLCYATEQNDELADTLAQAVVGMSAYYYLKELYSSSSYNRYTLLEQKQMPAMGADFKAIADQNLAWLAQPTGLGRLQNPCFTCAPNPYAPRTVNVY